MGEKKNLSGAFDKYLDDRISDEEENEFMRRELEASRKKKEDKDEA